MRRTGRSHVGCRCGDDLIVVEHGDGPDLLRILAVDAMVEKGHLHVGNKANAELGVVAIRTNFGRGAVVHLCTRAQADAIDRTVIATGA